MLPPPYFFLRKGENYPKYETNKKKHNKGVANGHSHENRTFSLENCAYMAGRFPWDSGGGNREFPCGSGVEMS